MEIEGISINFFVLAEMCTGTFQESGGHIPPIGTLCSSECVIESGRWGDSWCYTNDGAKWGAECVPCTGT